MIKTTLYTLILILFYSDVFSIQNSDSLKKNGIYFNVTRCLVDDMLNSGNTYLALGYTHRYKQYKLDFGGGNIVNHAKGESSLIGLDVARMKGFFIASELNKSLNYKKLYLGLQLLYRHSVSEQNIGVNPDIVTREAFSFLLKFGYCHFGKKGFGIDLGSGIGIKYISSFCNKPNAYNFIEYPAVRYYNSGSDFFPAILLLEAKLFKTF